MVTLKVLCEGPTETNFVTAVLKPHLARRSVFAKPTSLGGGLSWKRVRSELNLSLGDRRDHVWVTTIFDLYRLMNVPDCPPIESKGGVEKARLLEAAMKEGLPSPNFVPYLQVHEFEALLYVDLSRLQEVFMDSADRKAIESLMWETEALKPEEINEGESTAPSKRLVRTIKSYEFRKSTAGPATVEAIGLPSLRAACPHFNEWVTTLENLVPNPG